MRQRRIRHRRISPAWRYRAMLRHLSLRPAPDEPRLILRDRDLAVAYLRGRSTRLVLVFVSILTGRLHPDQMEFLGSASQRGQNHVLFICDRHHSWYSRPGIRQRIADLVRAVAREHGIETIWSIGNSMGAYGAILFSESLPISRVVAFVPQLLLDDWVISQDMWALYRPNIQDGVVRDLIPIMAAPDREFRLVVGDSDPDDTIHLAHLRQALPDAAHIGIVVVRGQQHQVARWLKAKGQLLPLIKALWDDDPALLGDCARQLGPELDLTLALPGPAVEQKARISS
jgi:pimeloyl-ACP methyl ester carboxylesterase